MIEFILVQHVHREGQHLGQDQRKMKYQCQEGTFAWDNRRRVSTMNADVPHLCGTTWTDQCCCLFARDREIQILEDGNIRLCWIGEVHLLKFDMSQQVILRFVNEDEIRSEEDIRSLTKTRPDGSSGSILR